MAYGTINADVIGTSVSGSNLGAGNATNFKNRIINGDMRIDQRNSGSSVTPTSNGQYTLDRFYASISASSKFSVQQNAGSVTPPAGFINYLGVTSLAATTVGSTDYYQIRQTIEGLNCADLDFGKSTAKTITISFWVRSSLTGTFSFAIFNNAEDRFYPSTYIINSANTWEQKTITIAGDTTGTWLTTNGKGIQINFSLGLGSSYTTSSANTWTSTSGYGISGATSVVGTNGATWYVTGVQLEVGSSATGFDYRDYTSELGMCQRYFVQSGFNGAGCSSGTGVQYPTIFFPQPMRTNPTITWISGGRIGNGVSDTAITGLSGTIGLTTINAGLTIGTASFGSGGQGIVMYNSPILSLSAEL